MVLARQRVEPFTDRQIELVRTFADQAVIAIENTRLLTETREALERQTATSDILHTIAAAPGDADGTLRKIAETTIRLFGAIGASFRIAEDGEFKWSVSVGAGAEHVGASLWDDATKRPTVAGRNLPGTVVRENRQIHLADLDHLDPDIADWPGPPVARSAGIRTMICTPLRTESRAIGVLTVYRDVLRPFAPVEQHLLQSFADQAAIAMENARLITETREALEQQTATAEVLQVINASPGDLAPVFDALLDKALDLCESSFGLLATYDGEFFHVSTHRGSPQGFVNLLREPFRPVPGMNTERLVRGETLVHILDLNADEMYRSGNQTSRSLADQSGARTAVGIALRRNDTLLGMINIYRREVRPFSDKQTSLLQNFAAQAVIAMENARLLTETREALEQQTATAEVLQVINTSPGDLGPVFEAILERAMRLCEAAFGSLYTYDGERFQSAAHRGVPPAYAAFREENPPLPTTGGGPATILATRKPLQVVDMKAHESYRRGVAGVRAMVDLGGVRTILTVPLIKDDIVLGIVSVYRQDVRAFSHRQITLLESFAAQAVIAMENARLVNETREALEQQTATAEVLQVINSSPGELAPVFDCMLEKALHLCGGAFGILNVFDGQIFHGAAMRGVPAAFAEFRAGNPAGLGSGTAPAQILAGENVVHNLDLKEEAPYRDGDPYRRAIVDLGGARSHLAVALRKDDALLGMLTIYRQEVRSFSGKEISLLQNFAAQAVIAIENARLLTETREALEQQIATAEVLQVINASPGDLLPVFDAILDKAHSLCGATVGNLAIYRDGYFHALATHGFPEQVASLMQHPFPPNPYTLELLEGARFRQIEDIKAIEIKPDALILRALVEYADVRTILFVPLRKDGALLGFISANRPEVRPFSDKEIALLENFAAQAVIAMENARLLTETREALEQQTATAEVLQVINASPGNLEPVFDAILEKAHLLCGAAKGSLVTYDGEHFHTVAVRGLSEHYEEMLREAREDHNPAGSPPQRLVAGENLIEILDCRTLHFPMPRAAAELEGARTILYVALRRGAALLGYITAYRQEVRKFSDKQIALLQNFAAQAVIAMENARLITETREALEQQTATAEVLQVINASPGDLAPVFDAMLERATSLCHASFGILWDFDGELARAGALHQVPEAYAELCRVPFRPSPGSGPARIMHGEDTFAIADLTEYAPYQAGDSLARAIVDLAGARSVVITPLRKDAATLGAITLYRQEVSPFTDKQIALLQNFAAQAVIAMENARLLTETREALEQQTATAEVLGVINSSPGDLTPVFDAILEKAHGLCDIALGELELHEDGKFRAVAMRGVSGPFAELLRQPFVPPPHSPLTHLLAGEPIVQITDLLEVARERPDDPRAQAGAQFGLRTVLFVPLRKDNALLGYITAYRKELRPFAEKEIALLQNFAAQAVIAIENTRLLTETREALEQQTATAEVLQVINASPGDPAPVFDAILEKAVRHCQSAFGALFTYDGQLAHFVAAYRNDPGDGGFVSRPDTSREGRAKWPDRRR